MRSIAPFHNDQVLVVDDNVEITQSISLLLGKRYKIFTANCTQEAIDLLEKNKFSVIILDFDLGEGEKDGVSLSNIVKEHNPFSNIILLTGNLEYNTIKRALNEGKINHFLNKPIIAKELMKQVEVSIEKYKESIKVTNLLKNPGDMEKIQLFVTDILKQEPNMKISTNVELQGVFIAYDSVPIFSKLKNNIIENPTTSSSSDDFGSLFSSFLSALVTLGTEAFINKEGQHLNGFKFQNYNFIFKFEEKFQFTYLVHTGSSQELEFDEIDILHRKIEAYIRRIQPKKYKAIQDDLLDTMIYLYFEKGL